MAANDETKWPGVTEEGKWLSKSVDLAAGFNVLMWRSMGISSRQTKPLLIKMIEITGVAPLSVCTPCREGTYAGAEHSSECQECPADTFSLKKASICEACDSRTSYSPPGSGQCLKRPPCTTADYYQVQQIADGNVERVGEHVCLFC